MRQEDEAYPAALFAPPAVDEKGQRNQRHDGD
jgi:hypothetical protein